MTPTPPSMGELSATITQLLKSQQLFQANLSANIHNLTSKFHDLRSHIPPSDFTSPFTYQPHPNSPTPYPWWYSLTPFPQYHPPKPHDSSQDPISTTKETNTVDLQHKVNTGGELFTNSDSVTGIFQEETLNMSQLQNRVMDPMQILEACVVGPKTLEQQQQFQWNFREDTEKRRRDKDITNSKRCHYRRSHR
ncbi:unnamed protein product [Vicia faba]|uniref:Uncharacterized protein n=1 Tax=Vicia faba TaxID=3906 RepID=A0AAV0YWT0_VICFA|nr:unnamed protein product [Vicia faba]CAI8590635.1 unnamed protein product [Vicia faba]